jgi:hypothetical protein
VQSVFGVSDRGLLSALLERAGPGAS